MEILIAAIFGMVFMGALIILLTPDKKPKLITKYQEYKIDINGVITYEKGVDITV